LAKIQTRQPVSGSRSFRGTLRGVNEQGTITLELKNQTTIQIPWQAVAKANLDIDF
jgi:ribosome maturation factor RimP